MMYNNSLKPIVDIQVRVSIVLLLASHPGGVEILLVASCYRNQDKLRSDGPLGSHADFTFYQYSKVFLSLLY